MLAFSHGKPADSLATGVSGTGRGNCADLTAGGCSHGAEPTAERLPLGLLQNVTGP